MRPLPIAWKRLVKDGDTCDRCGGTYLELQKALRTLRADLHPLGIEPTFEMQEIDESTFKADPSESNRILVAGVPMEDWLGATVGKSRCCAACGESDCRTVEVNDEIFETIPEVLIVEAGRRAARQLLAEVR